MDQNIAIGIHVPKLLDWLISRRHCKNDWRQEVVKIRAKINNAIQDMPAHETITNLLSGTYINYFHCLKIVEILETTEADTKNFFGGYSSKRMKDWQEIVNLYKKNNVYLAEAAQLLMNTVKYEVPNMKKLLSQEEAVQNEAKKKEAEAIKSSNSARNEQKIFLKELGFEVGEGPYRKKLIDNALQLNLTNENIVSATRDIIPAVEHYQNFTAISLPQHTVNLNHIKHIIEKGNTTVYELLNGEPPTTIILPPSVLKRDEEECEYNEDQIDWGFGESDPCKGESDAEDELDLGIDDGNSLNDCGFEIIDSSELLSEENSTENKEAPLEKVASGEKSLTVLENVTTRITFIKQLLELKNFLKMRLIEAKKEGPIDDLVESVKSLDEMHTSVETIINLLASKTNQHYFNILYAPKYLDGLVTKITEKEDAVERYCTIAKMCNKRKEDSIVEANKLTSKAQLMIKKARELQEEIKKDISGKYNGRTVSLMGGPTL